MQFSLGDAHITTGIRAMHCSISSLLLLQQQSCKSLNDCSKETFIYIVKAAFIQRLVRDKNMHAASWPTSLVKFAVGDENENILLCYYYEIDDVFPWDVTTGTQVKIYGSMTASQPYDSGQIFLVHKLKRMQ